ncbi:MAG: nucleotidyltransferase domain-containing protein [Desulfurococcales archaeon]|nr:nucleotidyltransferase domain-containing protein [Desulfurococcales archaeon]
MLKPSPHSSLIVTRDGLVGQVVGVPTPPGYLAIIPKYVECKGPSPWSYKDRMLCRIIPSYGPEGLARVMEALPGRWRRDPLYGTLMPYVADDEVLLFIHPRDALARLIASTPVESAGVVEAVYEIVEESGVSAGELGLTGSHALGAPHSGSDIDLVVYGVEGVVKVYDYFRGIRRGPSREVLEGLEVHPTLDISWRRSRVGGFRVTWVGAPIYWHCPPLSHYYRVEGPSHRYSIRACVEPGQTRALLYPPCVEAGDYWIVSYEYNLGGLFYEGGCFELRTMGTGDGVLYLGIREYPGLVRRL